jgi:hypothetical protein
MQMNPCRDSVIRRSPELVVYTAIMGEDTEDVETLKDRVTTTHPNRTPIPRSRKGTHPSRVSKVRNMITPMRSRAISSKPTVRTAEFLSGNRMLQKANASSRKATGIHNRLDREYPSRKGADVEQEASPTEKVKSPNGCKNGRCWTRPITVSSQGVTPRRQRPKPSSEAQEPCAVKVARTVPRGGKCREAPTYPDPYAAAKPETLIGNLQLFRDTRRANDHNSEPDILGVYHFYCGETAEKARDEPRAPMLRY